MTNAQAETEVVGCPERIEPPLERRPGNALNVEIGAPVPRCMLKPPGNWGTKSPGPFRWIRSGGSPFVLGPCNANCPLRATTPTAESDHFIGHRGAFQQQAA